MRATGLTTFSLVMLITGAVDSIRNLPVAALFGSQLIFFFVFSALVFLIPTALVSAELTSVCSERSGIFQWVKLAFGEKAAFVAIWLQWFSNLVWFPTMLSFVAGLFADLVDPALAQSKVYLVSFILITFWLLTIVNLRGIQVSAKFASFCALVGMALPMVVIIMFGLIWISTGKASHIHFSADSMLPSFTHVGSWVSLTAIMTAFAGMELSAVHVKDVADPQRTFPRALYLSVWVILLTMILGSLAIAAVVPSKDISLVNGFMQACRVFFSTYHIGWMVPVMAALILVGSVGGIISWVISPARGLLQAAQLDFLPAFFQRENRYGVAVNLLFAQAVIVSLFCLVYMLMPSVSGSYWFLTALSTQLYIIMYVVLFMAGIRLHYQLKDKPRSFSIPGKTPGAWIVCLLGLTGCLITLGVGFIPPGNINVGGTLHYEVLFGCGLVVAMLLPLGLILLQVKKLKSRLAN